MDVPLRKAVLRAVLARLAVLCNERNPNSVSPYGGHGELLAGGNPPMVFRVAFANTTAEQKLELLPQTQTAAATSPHLGQKDRAQPGGEISTPTRELRP
jgi:hypothetical protein